MNPEVTRLLSEIEENTKRNKILEGKLAEIQGTCDHILETFRDPHAAGYTCTVCGHMHVRYRSLCKTPWECNHPPMDVERILQGFEPKGR